MGLRVNKGGETVIEPQFKSAYEFSEGLALVMTRDKYGFVNRAGKVVISEAYDVMTGSFSEGLAPVCKLGKCGFINVAGDTIIPAQFDVAFQFHRGLARIHQHDKIGYIDRTGKFIWLPTR